MTNNFLNLNIDSEFINVTNSMLSSQKATKTYIDNHSGGTDPNEIPDGTVFEGTFSNLPQFFESLDGKYCKGTVTYNIIDDEVVTPTNYLNSGNYIGVAVRVPKFFIKNLIINGNEHTLTVNPTFSTNYTTLAFFANDSVEGKVFVYPESNNPLYQKVTLQYMNIGNTKATRNSGIWCKANISLDIDTCTVYCYGDGTISGNLGSCIGIQNGVTNVTNCELYGSKGRAEKSSGIVATYCGKVFSSSNIFNDCYWAVDSICGGLYKSVMEASKSNVSYLYHGYKGGLGQGYNTIGGGSEGSDTYITNGFIYG